MQAIAACQEDGQHAEQAHRYCTLDSLFFTFSLTLKSSTISAALSQLISHFIRTTAERANTRVVEAADCSSRTDRCSAGGPVGAPAAFRVGSQVAGPIRLVAGRDSALVVAAMALKRRAFLEYPNMSTI